METRNDLHQRAREAMADAMAGMPETGERAWLESHRRECAACAQTAERMREAVTALRSAPVRADAALVEATRRSVRPYAERLGETESRMRMVLVSSALAAVVGAVSLPYLLRALAWLGGFAGLPEAAVVAAVVVVWLVPGLLAALAVSRRPQFDVPPAHQGPEARRTV
jgi:hypothetical protein